MTYSGYAKYRDAQGTLTASTERLVFTSVDGFLSKREIVVITIPTDAILDIKVERGIFSKKIIVLVDNARVPGIPRHEFEVPDPAKWVSALRSEMMGKQEQKRGPQEFQRTTVIKETIKEREKEIYIRCQYCEALVPEGEDTCSNCGAILK